MTVMRPPSLGDIQEHFTGIWLFYLGSISAVAHTRACMGCSDVLVLGVPMFFLPWTAKVRNLMKTPIVVLDVSQESSEGTHPQNIYCS